MHQPFQASSMCAQPDVDTSSLQTTHRNMCQLSEDLSARLWSPFDCLVDFAIACIFHVTLCIHCKLNSSDCLSQVANQSFHKFALLFRCIVRSSDWNTSICTHHALDCKQQQQSINKNDKICSFIYQSNLSLEVLKYVLACITKYIQPLPWLSVHKWHGVTHHHLSAVCWSEQCWAVVGRPDLYPLAYNMFHKNTRESDKFNIGSWKSILNCILNFQ